MTSAAQRNQNSARGAMYLLMPAPPGPPLSAPAAARPGIWTTLKWSRRPIHIKPVRRMCGRRTEGCCRELVRIQADKQDDRQGGYYASDYGAGNGIQRIHFEILPGKGGLKNRAATPIIQFLNAPAVFGLLLVPAGRPCLLSGCVAAVVGAQPLEATTPARTIARPIVSLPMRPSLRMSKPA